MVWNGVPQITQTLVTGFVDIGKIRLAKRAAFYWLTDGGLRVGTWFYGFCT